MHAKKKKARKIGNEQKNKEIAKKKKLSLEGQGYLGVGNFYPVNSKNYRSVSVSVSFP